MLPERERIQRIADVEPQSHDELAGVRGMLSFLGPIGTPDAGPSLRLVIGTHPGGGVRNRHIYLLAHSTGPAVYSSAERYITGCG